MTQSGLQAAHTYTTPGKYIASVSATVGGAVHDNFLALLPISVTSNFASGSAGNVPGVAGSILSNTTPTTGTPATAVLTTGEGVSFAGSYTSAPTNPLYVFQPPTLAAPSGATVSNAVNTNSSASGTFTFPNSGIFWVTFVGTAKTAQGAEAFQNYTWTVFVAPSGFHAASSGAAAAKSPHPGSLVVYELAPGGAGSEDPAIDYETLGYEPIENVYQTLIMYNGSQTGPTPSNYVPVIATCVPGSISGANSCQALYNSPLVTGSDYTFVVGKHAQFYDPATKVSWGVYPTDVVFSVARTMAFSTLPGPGSNNGWILTQSLLSAGNSTWNTIHGAYNNTPQNIWNSMTINGTDCPAAAMTNDHGCVTFHVNANGVNWPYFLELIADPLGASIVPAGWFSAPAQAAGIPYWTEGNVTGAGDHPVPTPGTSGYGVDWSTISPTAWDAYETAGSSPPFVGNVQFAMLGSGPYYMSVYTATVSYVLAANPAYVANPYCTWAGCQPAAGAYAGDVSVTWETTQVPGEQAYAAGVADLASIPSTDTAFLLQLIQQGKIAASSFPSITVDFFPFNLNFSVAGAHSYTSNPITVPADFFSYEAMRQLFAHTWPYSTIQSTINTKLGIEFDFNYGGAIPQFMANYYPTNVSWPTGDPDTNPADVGGAAWWWAQATNPSSQFYDPEAAACTTSSPCQLPVFGQTGAPDLDQRIALWVSQVTALTGGKVVANALDINFIDAVINSLYLGPYANPMPVYRLGWAPDYPDPTDYVAPLYKTNSTYALGDNVAQQLFNSSLSQFDAASCGIAHPAIDYTYWSNLAQTLSTGGGIPNNCQGVAYQALQNAMADAAVLPASPQRVLVYAEAEQIANALALYVYTFQYNIVVTTASWLDPTTYNSNVTSGGGADSTWYTIA